MPKASENEPIEPPTGNDKTSQIVDLAKKHAILFHDPDKVGYARVKVKRHREVYSIDSEDFGFWLEALVLDTLGFAISPGRMSAVRTTLSALARHKGKTKSVYLRVAKRKGKYYIDLCDKLWRAVEVDEAGWRIVTRPPVMFRRTSKMRALPEPAETGKFKPILRMINLPKDDWILVLTWIIECYRSDTPYVGLQLSGEAGAAKSSSQDKLCSLIDPCKRNLRTKPKERSDIFVLANNAHLLSYENLSGLSSEMQDAFCPILTGGAESAVRKLNTNSEISTIDIQKPVVLNGINPVVTAADLMERFITVDLTEITSARITEGELAKRWKRNKATIFAGILNRFAMALAELKEVRKEQHQALPRMADFALLGEAVARSVGKGPGWFIDMFNARRGFGADAVLGESDIGTAICCYLAKHKNGLSGSFQQIDEALRATHRGQHPNSPKPKQSWPGTGKGMGDALRRLGPALKSKNILVERRLGHARATIWTIRHDQLVAGE